MSKPSFSLANFKKVHSDGSATVLKHPDGHEIKIDHTNLRPAIKKQLEKLPIAKADGGDVAPVETAPAPPQMAPQELEQFKALKQKYMNQMAQAKDMYGAGFTPDQIDRQSTELAHNDIQQGIDKQQAAEKARVHDLEIASQAQKMGYSGTVQGPPESQLKPEIPKPQSPQLASYQQGRPEQAPSAPSNGNINLNPGQPEQGAPQEQVPQQRFANPYELEQQVAKDYANNIQKIQEANMAALQHLSGEIVNTVKDIHDSHINPNAYLENMSVGNKIGTAIGLILGGAGAGLSHTNNAALSWLDNQIQRNVDAQKNELGKKESILSAYMNQYGNLKTASDMALATQNAWLASKFQQAGAMSNDPMYKQRAMDLYMQYMQKAQSGVQAAAGRHGIQSAGIDPGMKLKAMATMGYMSPHDADQGYKELTNLNVMNEGRKETFEIFNNALNDIGLLGAMNPQSYERLKAQIQPIALKLARDAAGRVSEAELPGIVAMFPARGDTQQTLEVKKRRLDAFTRQKMQSSLLSAHGINVDPFPMVMQNPQQPASFNRRR